MHSTLDVSSIGPLVLVGGKGGVGKTTVAAALALALAEDRPDRRILLLSTDPAHSLRDALLPPGKEQGGPPNLRTLELDAEHAFREFRDRHRQGLRKIALSGTFLDQADVENILGLALPGLDEISALQAISSIAGSAEVDHLIVDTAPSGHTLRLLAMPGLLEGWRDALDRLLEKHRFLSQRYGGGYVPDEADDVISELDRIVRSTRELLTDRARTSFLLVLNADPLSMWESRNLLEALKRLGIEVRWILVNRVVDGTSRACFHCAARREAERPWLERIRSDLARPTIEIPWLSDEPRGDAALSKLGRMIVRGEPADPTPVEAGPARANGGSSDPGAVRFEEWSLFLVCGKGGVGKTTVASALGVWLASRRRERVLLFSTDPAHSLSDAFGVRIGPAPREVAPGLTAVEADPESCLASLRAEYRGEIAEAFRALLATPNAEASLDQEAMEGLIDLSPPGLDEIVAFAELSRHLRQGAFDRIVVDTAPAGHFLRFLELPATARSWLRAFFEILLKYRKVLRAPRIQTLLIELSRSIRGLQEVLGRPDQTTVLPVALPTALSFEETRDVLSRTRQLGLVARIGVLNRVLGRSGSCPLCSRRGDSSRSFLADYSRAFPEIGFRTLEEQGSSPIGAEALGRIGSVLFA